MKLFASGSGFHVAVNVVASPLYVVICSGDSRFD